MGTINVPDTVYVPAMVCCAVDDVSTLDSVFISTYFADATAMANVAHGITLSKRQKAIALIRKSQKLKPPKKIQVVGGSKL